MKIRWMLGGVAVALLLWVCGGCTSGGNAPKPMSANDYITRGQQALESVTTYPTIGSIDAGNNLRAASAYFAQALKLDATNAKAKMGLVLTNTFIGLYDLLDVMPSQMRPVLRKMITDPLQTRSRIGLDLPRAISRNALAAAPATRASETQNAQLRIASKTLPTLRQMLPLFEDVQTAVANGEEIRLRMYVNGSVRTVVFGVADVQLASAYANLLTAIMNLTVAFNLDMPESSMVKALPMDVNSNGLLEAEEYLAAQPLFEKLYPQATQSFLQYLRYAMNAAYLGSGVSGHTAGEYALIDVTDPQTLQELKDLNELSNFVAKACTMPVTTDKYFGDRVTRTVDLTKLTAISSLRPLMPTFQQDNLTTPGIWPDPSFRGAVWPPIPPNYFELTYEDMEKAYKRPVGQ